MSRKLSEHSEEELLAELLSRSKMRRGPFRVSFVKTPINVIVGIGKDHHADIYLEDEAYDQLRQNVERKRSLEPADNAEGSAPREDDEVA